MSSNDYLADIYSKTECERVPVEDHCHVSMCLHSTSPVDVVVKTGYTVKVKPVGSNYYEQLAREMGLFPSRKRK